MTAGLRWLGWGMLWYVGLLAAVYAIVAGLSCVAQMWQTWQDFKEHGKRRTR